MIYYIYQNKEIKNNTEENGYDETEKNYINIDIYSPLFDILSKTKNFEQIFTIKMNSYDIISNENDYRKLFNNLNKLNKNLSVFYRLRDDKGKFYLKEFNITKIKN